MQSRDIGKLVRLSTRLWIRQLTVPTDDGASLDVYVSVAGDGDVRPKPILVLLQGSGAASVFGRKDGMTFAPCGLVPLLAYLDRWHVVTVEKRGVRLGDFEPSPQEYSQEYVAHESRPNRIHDVVQAIEALRAGPFSTGSGVCVVGSSEGAHVACGVARACTSVSALGLLGFGGGQALFAELVNLRKSLRSGEIDADTFQQCYAECVERARQIQAQPASTADLWSGHTYRRWSSFGMHAAEWDLAHLDIPIFLAIASEDTSAPPETADLLVAEAARLGKRNLEVRNYVGLDHGFFAHTPDGARNQQGRVIDDLMAWVAAVGMP